MGKKKLNPEEWRETVAQIREAKELDPDRSIEELCSSHGVNESAYYYNLKKLGGKVSTPPATEKRRPLMQKRSARSRATRNPPTSPEPSGSSCSTGRRLMWRSPLRICFSIEVVEDVHGAR
jgi:hypothetical protein